MFFLLLLFTLCLLHKHNVKCHVIVFSTFVYREGTKTVLISSKVLHPPLPHTLALNNRCKQARGSLLSSQTDGCCHGAEGLAEGWKVQEGKKESITQVCMQPEIEVIS